MNRRKNYQRMLAQKNCEIQVLKVIFNLEIISKLTGPALWTSPFGCQVVKNKSKLKIRRLENCRQVEKN